MTTMAKTIQYDGGNAQHEYAVTVLPCSSVCFCFTKAVVRLLADVLILPLFVVSVACGQLLGCSLRGPLSVVMVTRLPTV